MAETNDDDIPDACINAIIDRYPDMEPNGISRKFKDGLEKIGKTIEEISMWRYCGGNDDGHELYFKMLFGERFMPQSENCVCETKIKTCCYITPDKTDRHADILVLGSCCIKRFIPKDNRGKRCQRCNNPHRNNMIDMCSSCIKDDIKREKEREREYNRIKKQTDCEKCIKVIMEGKYKRCYECNMKKKGIVLEETCKKCVIAKTRGYRKCYDCNMNSYKS